jgi:hypothetical protein
MRGAADPKARAKVELPAPGRGHLLDFSTS